MSANPPTPGIWLRPTEATDLFHMNQLPESARDCRRLQSLRGWGHEQAKTVFGRGTRPRSSDGAGSSAFSRRRRFGAGVPGARWKMSSLLRWNGSGGSTTTASSDPSGMRPQPSTKRHTTTAWRPRPSRPDSTQTVSDTPAAIHPEARPASHANSNPDTRPRQPTTTEAAEKGGRDIGACPGRVGRRGGCEAGGPPVQRLGAFRV